VLFILANYLGLYLLIRVCFFCLFLCGAAEKIGESWKLWQPNTEDPLLAAVDLLESNWKLVQNVLQLTHCVLTRIFVVLWPKKKEEMPGENLRKLLEAFDIPEDPVLAMKRRLVKRGVEGAIALAQSHGEDMDWEKIGSSRARPLPDILKFFEKAKGYAPRIVSLITPSAASSTSAPGSSMPPPSVGATDSFAPSTATEPAAEVA
jgi:hypothetical protein